MCAVKMEHIQRKWLSKNTPGSNKKEKHNGSTISVISYNILASLHMKSWTYPFCPHGYRENIERHPQLMVELKHNKDTDIICLQEVDTEYYQNTLMPELQTLGYSGVHAEKMLGIAEGVAVFYKADLYDLEHFCKIIFSEEIGKLLESHSVKESLRKSLKERCNHESVGLLCRFTRKSHSQPFTFNLCNVHLLWKVKEYGDVNALQTGITVQRLSSSPLPFILCGDFNHTPLMPGYQILKNGNPNPESLQLLKEQFAVEDSSLPDMLPESFQSRCTSIASSYFTVMGEEPPFTNYTDDIGTAWLETQQKETYETECHDDNAKDNPSFPPPRKISTLDYIWYSSDSFECLGVLDLVDQSQITPFWACPNKVFPSDHFLMKSKFGLLK